MYLVLYCTLLPLSTNRYGTQYSSIVIDIRSPVQYYTGQPPISLQRGRERKGRLLIFFRAVNVHFLKCTTVKNYGN